MTLAFLSEGAKRLASYVAETGIDVDQLMDVYDRWRSGDAPSPPDYRRRWRVRCSPTSEGALVSPAERPPNSGRTAMPYARWCGTPDHQVKSRWHDAKLRAIGGMDRDKKLLALRHLDADDF